MTGTIRNANEGDLDTLVWIVAAAFQADPTYNYRYPYLNQYLDDFAYHTRLRYQSFLANPAATVMVYEVVSNENPSIIKPVAFSVWPPVLTAAASTTASAHTRDESESQFDIDVVAVPPRRYAVPARIMAMQADINAAKQRLFIDKYGERQLFLGTLACHPDYQRRGAGMALISWGLEKARAESLPITLFASPTGYHMYQRLGFRNIASFFTQVSGEEEMVEHNAMVLEP